MPSFSCTKKHFEHLALVPQRFVLQVVYEQFHGSTEDLSFEHLEHVRHFILTSMTGKKQDFGKQCIIQNSYNTIVFQAKEKKREAPTLSKVQLTIPGKTIWNGYTITAQFQNHSALCMDYDRTKKLFVRSWKDGDVFTPLGMKGRKKLQDFFTDEKIPQQKREQIPLIVDRQDNIIAVYNLRIDDTVKVTDTTKKILYFSIVP